MRIEILINTVGLWSGYGGKPVLQGVDMQVAAGEIVAVIGRNGVGAGGRVGLGIGIRLGSVHWLALFTLQAGEQGVDCRTTCGVLVDG